MLQRKKSVLFVSHKANRSGAPLLLVNIIRHFKQSTKIPFKILVLEDGELVKDFHELGKTYVWKKNTIHASTASVKRNFLPFVSRFSFIIRGFYILFHIRNTKLLLYNTIANGHMYRKLSYLRCPSICYVHELEAAIHMATNKQILTKVLNNTDLFLAPSEAVKKNLHLSYNIQENKIRLIPYSMNETFRTKQIYSTFISNFKTSYSIPDSAVIIGVLGSTEWRKGFDFFLPLTTIYFELFSNSNVFFIWKGFNKKADNAYFDAYDFNKFSINPRVILLPHGSDNIEQLACFDIHLLLSREDPYPLVVLEAASFGIPTLCFSGSGGSPEFVENDAGYCIPYGNLMKMANSIHELANDSTLRNNMGLKAAEKLQLRHNIKKGATEIVELVENML
jgi:glycosyltransferase involved in cell wall biosynthesis